MTLKELAATALRGTARADLAKPDPSPLGEALARVKEGSPEQLLLARAALAGLHARAGMALDAAETPPPVTLPPASHPLPEKLWPLLRQLVGTPFGLAALDNIRERSWTLNAAQVLSLSGEQADIIHEFWPLLDERGKAVLDAHPMHRAWEKAEAEAQWQSRLSAMQELRQTDATAGAAQTLQLWQDINADEKRDLLDLLERQLLPEDLPLLQHAEKDRSAEVQQRARMLQGHLPGPLQDELLALLPSVVVNKRGKISFEPFSLPEALRTARTGLSEESDFQHLLGALPPALMLDTLDVSAAALLMAARPHWDLYDFLAERMVPLLFPNTLTLPELLTGDSGAHPSVLTAKLHAWQDEGPAEQLQLTCRVLEQIQRSGADWRLGMALEYAAAILPPEMEVPSPQPQPLTMFAPPASSAHGLTPATWNNHQTEVHEQRQAQAEAAWRELTDILRLRREWAAALEEV